jgi:hypothetical protein
MRALNTFGEADEYVDVATLFDVFEHVPDTIECIKKVPKRSKIMGFHITSNNYIGAFENLAGVGLTLRQPQAIVPPPDRVL